MSKKISAHGISFGGGAPIVIQTMCDVKTSKIADVMREIQDVYELGCQVVRVSVKDFYDAKAIKTIVENSLAFIVADIHFDYRLALAAIDSGVKKIRINPGNIGGEDNLKILANAVKENDVIVRVGSNSGSIEKSFLKSFGRTPVALAESALEKVALLEKYGVNKIVVSAKASDVQTTVKAYRYLAEKTDYPLHLGVTEAGTYDVGIVKSSIGIGSLLLDGIGDTIRVSLTAPIQEEVLAAKRILRAVGLDKNYVEVVSCPTCGRTSYDLGSMVKAVEEATAKITKPLKIAVMGCVVNGPGEAADCDIGIAGGEGKCVIFKKGVVFKTVSTLNAQTEFLNEVEKLIK